VNSRMGERRIFGRTAAAEPAAGAPGERAT